MALRGESHPAHKLTERQVRSIRQLWSVGHRNIRVLAIKQWSIPSQHSKDC